MQFFTDLRHKFQQVHVDGMGPKYCKCVSDFIFHVPCSNLSLHETSKFFQTAEVAASQPLAGVFHTNRTEQSPDIGLEYRIAK
jgi:hypothetical protein